jgi:hypothetical protein
MGDERLIMHYYMMDDESLDGCERLEEFLTNLLVTETECRRRLSMKHEADKAARAVELVSDALATRIPITPSDSMLRRWRHSMRPNSALSDLG